MTTQEAKQPRNDTLLLTASDLRRELGNISSSQLYKMVKGKVFTPVKGFKRHRRFPRKQLQDFIDNNK